MRLEQPRSSSRPGLAQRATDAAATEPTAIVNHAEPVEADYFGPFQRLPIPVHSMGPDGRLLKVNKTWVTYTGYAEHEAIGHTFADFLDPASALRYREKAVPELIDNVPTWESRSVEYRLVKRSGEIADILLTARPERDPDKGRFQHSLAVIVDITDRNRAETALRQAQKLEALGSLTGGVAHDFNNLLAVISGSLELLGKRLPADDQRAARLVSAARQAAQRGEALTTRLLAFARQQELSPRPLDLCDLLASLRPLLKQLLGAGVDIEEDLPEDLWRLCADPNQFELALLNLAANARDAMPDGGRLRLIGRNVVVQRGTNPGFVAPSAPTLPNGDYVVLCVGDTGTGMDEAALSRATDPFFTTKGPGKGTGLGLSMAHGFALQSGGALWLTSQLGIGTDVEIWLPRTTDTMQPGAAPAMPQAQAAPRQLRILLVDDDPLVLANAAAMLEELGHDQVYAAASGHEALQALRRNGPFDLLLTDYMMPGMSGAQLATQAQALCADLPVLMASGFAELDAVLETRWQRLRKPYSLKMLADALGSLRARPQPAMKAPSPT
ncbi:MAG TPA: response regulator [Rhodopila sp.]|nr:response regulator [Rhodopila sp.]